VQSRSLCIRIFLNNLLLVDQLLQKIFLIIPRPVFTSRSSRPVLLVHLVLAASSSSCIVKRLVSNSRNVRDSAGPAKDKRAEPDIYAGVSYHPSFFKPCEHPMSIYTGKCAPNNF